MRARWRTLAALVATLCLPLSVTACGSGPVPPTYLRTAAPNQLNAVIGIGMYSQRQSAPQATIQFNFSSTDGHNVLFSGDERITCDGHLLKLTNTAAGYATTLPLADVAGKTLSCDYTSGADSVTISMPMPIAPHILTPSEGANLPRGKTTLVTYQAPPGKVTGVQALDVNNNQEPLNVTIKPNQAIIDTTVLDAGPGTISLFEDIAPSVPEPNPFHSLKAQIVAEDSVNVNWQ